MRLLLPIFLVSVSAHAILPLPYPTEPLAEDTLVTGVESQPESLEGYNELFSKGQLREMELPSFDGQKEALGYEPGRTFTVPEELKARVEFWKKIYAQYTTHQVVLHDADNLDVIYDVVDISPVAFNPNLSQREQRRLVSRFIKAEKDKVVAALKSLHQLKDDPMRIPPDLFPLFRKFEGQKDPERFLKAAGRVRGQVGQRDRIVRGFLYSGRYLKRMMEIFEQKQVPKELTRLPLVESGFDLTARSKVGASGIWQFMRSTGKRYLRIDRLVDERNDPISATWAAAELLRSNYEKLGSWPLAVTAYNHGPEGMARAVRELSTRDLPYIIRHYKARTFGFASANFYSEFLAILEVEREYRRYFGKMMTDSPITYEEFRIGDNVRFSELAGACGLKDEELAVLNPALTDWVLAGNGPVPQGYLLKVPPGRSEKCRSGYRNISKVSLRTGWGRMPRGG